MKLVRMHRKNANGQRYRNPVQVERPKRRNDRAIMLARQRTHIKVQGITEHYPINPYVHKSACSECGLTLWRR